VLTSRKLHLSRAKMLSFLDELTETAGSAVSLYLPRGKSLKGVEDPLQRGLAAADSVPDIEQAVADSQTGAVIFWGSNRKCLILPPFPIKAEHVSEGYDTGPLRSLLSYDFVIGIVLVRLGAYSIGICRGTDIIDSKTGTGVVHARHKKGGSSQARFARHRDKQIESFLGRVCDHTRERLQSHARSLDYLVYGGAWTTILSLRKRCHFLSQFDDRILRMLLDIPDPRQTVLEKALDDIWTTTVIEWREHGD
jgi:peptide subunit release factor 1 (eRF1)